MPQCYQSVIVNAPIEKVWDTIKNFHDMSWASRIITKCEAVGAKKGTEVGAMRILNEAFHETLVEFNESDYRFSYSIDDGPFPVSASEVKNYKGQVQLKPVTLNGNTFVEWRSAWESDSEEARDFCHQIYVALLKALAEQV